MTIILLTLAVVVCLIFVTKLLGDNTGSVLIELGNQRFGLDLIEFIILLVLGFFLLYFAFRIIGWILKAPKKASQWNENRHAKNVGKVTQKGYADLIKGDYQNAEKKLMQNIDKSATPFLNFMAAAHAAHLQGDDTKRDKYFELAYQSDPSSKTAIDISQAQMQYDSGDLKAARETLLKALPIAPKNEQLLRMSLEVNRDLENWGTVMQQLPQLKKCTSISDEEVDLLSYEAATALLDSVDSHEALESAWKNLSRAQRNDADYKRVFASRLSDLGKPYQCEQFIIKSVKKDWDSELIYLFGLLENDAKRQLKTALYWLKSQPEDANLLLTCGRLSLRNDLKDEAKAYFEKAIAAGANEEADRELAKLLEEEGDLQKALEYYRSGMEKLSFSPESKTNKVDASVVDNPLEDSDDIIIVSDDEKSDEKDKPTQPNV